MDHGAQPHFGHLFQGDLAVATSLAPFPSYVRHLHGWATRKCCARWCVMVRVMVCVMVMGVCDGVCVCVCVCV